MVGRVLCFFVGFVDGTWRGGISGEGSGWL